MANVGLKNGIYHIRFRFDGKEYKKSLKVNQRSAAHAAKNIVELTIVNGGVKVRRSAGMVVPV